MTDETKQVLKALLTDIQALATSAQYDADRLPKSNQLKVFSRGAEAAFSHVAGMIAATLANPEK